MSCPQFIDSCVLLTPTLFSFVLILFGLLRENLRQYWCLNNFTSKYSIKGKFTTKTVLSWFTQLPLFCDNQNAVELFCPYMKVGAKTTFIGPHWLSLYERKKKPLRHFTECLLYSTKESNSSFKRKKLMPTVIS